MSLAPGERRALAKIEESLSRTDRKLAAKLATFNVLASRRRLRWRWLSPWRLRLRRIIPVGWANARSTRWTGQRFGPAPYLAGDRGFGSRHPPGDWTSLYTARAAV
jgi:hypothetical protein